MQQKSRTVRRFCINCGMMDGEGRREFLMRTGLARTYVLRNLLHEGCFVKFVRKAL